MDVAGIEKRLSQLAELVPGSRPEFERLLAGRVTPELPADPWARTLLVGLTQHLPRQRWVGLLVETKLRGSTSEIAEDGAFGHPEELPGHGKVPGLEDWSYRFHGVGCCLTHSSGEVIDVDFVDGSPDWIDPFFYLEYLRTSRRPSRAEARLVEPDPLAGFWMADVATLRTHGLIEGDHRVRLTEAGERWGMTLEGAWRLVEEEDSSAETRAWIALELGDPVSALGYLEDPPSPLVELARRATAARALSLREQAHQPGLDARFAVQALAQLGREHAEPTLVAALERGPLDGVVARALEVVCAWDDPALAEAICSVAEAAKRTSPPDPFIRSRAITQLMRQGPRALSDGLKYRLVRCMRSNAGGREARVAYLLTLIDPEESLERLTVALRSEIPLVREEAAAALAVVGTREAIEVLRRCETPEAQTVVALLRGLEPVSGPEPRGQVINWKGKPKRVYRMDEVAAAQVGEFTAMAFHEFMRVYEELDAIWNAS